jgi:acetyltransferase-like isoleucine patch superfamily enzyme
MPTIHQRISLTFKHRGLLEGVIFLFSFLLQLARGILLGYKMVFIGKGVKIRCRRKVKIGKFTRIEDFAELDGFGDYGLQIGRYCKVGKYSILRVPGSPYICGAGITLGDNTTFAEFCFVGGAGKVEIGERNAFGQFVSIHPQNHLMNTEKSSATSEVGIKIGDDNWIGAKAIVLDGSVIGNQSIVAAGSVVMGEFQDNVLIAGAPGCVKKSLAVPNRTVTSFSPLHLS